MRISLPSLLTLSVVSMGGCASGTVVNQRNDPVVVMLDNGAALRYDRDIHVVTSNASGTPASLWARLNAAYSDLGLAVTSRDSADFAIGAQNAQFNGRFGKSQMSRIINCGTTPFGTERANAYRVWLTVATQLQASGTGTKVRTSIAARAQDQSSSTAAVQCGSTGALEADIAAALGAN